MPHIVHSINTFNPKFPLGCFPAVKISAAVSLGCTTIEHLPFSSDKTAQDNPSHTFSFSFFLPLYRIVWVYLSVGIWVYPLLGLFSSTGLVAFFSFNMSVVALLYMLGDKLNNHFWGK